MSDTVIVVIILSKALADPGGRAPLAPKIFPKSYSFQAFFFGWGGGIFGSKLSCPPDQNPGSAHEKAANVIGGSHGSG